MRQFNKSFLFVLLFSFITSGVYSSNAPLDVLHYHLALEVDISQKLAKGKVDITFKLADGRRRATFNTGGLQINQVQGSSVKSYQHKDGLLLVDLEQTQRTPHQIAVSYQGHPERGLLFNPELNQAYTVYHTSQWMVCHEEPSDKATFSLDILVDDDLKCIASGELSGIKKQNGKKRYQWEQRYATPAYTYGFAIGPFMRVSEKVGRVQLNYLSAEFNEDTLKQVFKQTGDILQFFEEKSGIPYMQNAYSQVLMGNHYQEMSGLAVLRNSYAAAVLKDSSEIHLTAHELAHQWWGNRITCASLDHFWLNEAFAVYMASAYNEYHFGKAKYSADIALYKGIYDRLLKRGKDKPLVFPNWAPTRDNRHVVYYKGAYILHLLREKLGSEAFWQGIRAYSQQFIGKAVTTEDFKNAMEKATGINLDAFFKLWVYQKQQ